MAELKNPFYVNPPPVYIPAVIKFNPKKEPPIEVTQGDLTTVQMYDYFHAMEQEFRKRMIDDVIKHTGCRNPSAEQIDKYLNKNRK